VLSDDVAICSFLMSDFEDLKSSLALSYTKFVGLKMKRIKNSYANLISKDAKTRLFQFLKDWADQEGERVGNKVVIELPDPKRYCTNHLHFETDRYPFAE
jgi:CRP/FNR family transcriptional regulator